MRTVVIFLLGLLISWPNKANADHNLYENDIGIFFALEFGITSTIGSTIIFPLIGRAVYDGENPPYWKAVGFTFLASTAGVGVVWMCADRVILCESGGRIGPHDYDILYPTVFGAVATYLTYRYLSPQSDKSTSALWQYAPQIAVLPIARGGSIRLNWSF